MNLFLAFERRPIWFRNPRSLITCHCPAELPMAFKQLEKWLDAGWHAAGFLSYEAGYAFEPRLYSRKQYAFPVLHMGAYPGPLAGQFIPDRLGSYQIRGLHLNTGFGEYARNIRRIRTYIAQGDVYQITYCIKNRFQFEGNPQNLFADLFRAQPVPYAAYLESNGYSILSLSPERFVRKREERVLTEPMKGTWPRGSSPVEDQRQRRDFSQDPKNRAENVMIADLLRNDLGRIGHGIRAPKLFTITAYKTLYQMTSTVIGQVPKGIALLKFFQALFPSGSVTGAPKIRAMEIIREIEPEERNIYTGAIGFIAPNRDLYFNVPIRTLLIRGTAGEMGVGGGIVWDSTARGEWREGLLKSRFLRETAQKKI